MKNNVFFPKHGTTSSKSANVNEHTYSLAAEQISLVRFISKHVHNTMMKIGE